jgi:putative DNA primase/helicase
MSTAPKSAKTRSPAHDWARLATPLAAWADKHMVNRRDAYGGYYAKDGSTHQTTKKAEDRDGPLTLARIVRHFEAGGTDDVIGLHAIGFDEAGECVSRWILIDIDRHDDKGDPDANLRIALAWYALAVSLGFRPLLYDSNGRGGYHLVLVFSAPIPARTAFTFAVWLTRDWEERGLDRQPETFPRQAGIARDRFGNWARLPGRHHTRDHFTRVWSGEGWLDGATAIRHIIATVGASADTIPEEARPGPEATFDLGADIDRKRAGSIALEGKTRRQPGPEGTLLPGQDYNGRTKWGKILEPAGWVCDHESEGTGFWRRPDKAVGHGATTAHDEHDTLYVFTDAAPPFVQHGSYSKFGAYTALNHGGSFEAAAKSLFEEGYGTFLAWRWDDETGKWSEGVHQNPCPTGGFVRIREPGQTKPNVPAKAKAIWRKKDDRANGSHAANGQADGPPGGVDPPPTTRVDDSSAPEINPTDTGNSLRLVRDHGDVLRYCVEWGKWLRWDGRRWKEDRTGSVYRMARKTIQRIGAEAASSSDPDDRKALLRWGMIHLARFVEGIPVETAQLDRDPWLLNARNGTIDLRTGELRPHRREDLITKLVEVDYDPLATCPRWDRFEREIMDGDEAMVGYLRRIAGYAITGDVREHKLFFFHGEGRNGKSLWLLINHWLLGDYATTINSSLITAKQHDDHPTGLTDLEGKRFVSTIEVADGKKMAEALVQQLTGGDPIKARRMRQDFYTFMPTHKIILAANHKPDIRETTEAIWERVRLILFPVTFVDPDRVDPAAKLLLKDKGLEKTLWAEAPGILATLVRACLEWQRDGLKEPEAVVRATAGYRAEMDRLTDFIAERCLVSVDVRVKANALYESYRAWAKASGEHEISKRKFGSNMDRRGYTLKESNGVSWRLGVTVKSDDTSVF